MSLLLGTYSGTVENVRDPEKLGRVKVRVAHVYGASTTGAGYIGVNDLPWALPAGLPAGGSGASGGLSHLPNVGDHVFVRFLDGEPEKPVWEWGNQTFSDRDRVALHSYDTAADGTVGLPKAARWLRYGHTYEINETGLLMTSSQGYSVQIVDGQPSDGEIILKTQLGNYLKLSDLDNGVTALVNADWTFQIGASLYGTSDDFSWTTMTDGFVFDSGDQFEVSCLGDFSTDATGTATITSASSVTLVAPRVALGSVEASEPLLLGNIVLGWMESVYLFLTTHTHGNGNNGSPTTPALSPAPIVPEVLSTTSFTD